MHPLSSCLLRWCLVILAALTLSGCTVAQKKARALERADRFYAADELEKAKLEYLNVLRLDPKDLRANERVGLIWFEQGAPLRAGQYLSVALDATPTNDELRSKVALALLAMGKVEAARQQAMQILSRSPQNKEAIVLLSETVRNVAEYHQAEQFLNGVTDRRTASYLIATSNLQLRKGDTAGALASLQRARGYEPKFPEVHSALAAHYLRLNNRVEAAKSYKEAAEVAPARSIARLAYGESLILGGKTEEGVTYLKEITQRTPDYLPAWLSLARHAMSQADYTLAASHLQKVFVQDNANFQAHVLSAEISFLQGEKAKAIDALTKLAAAYPTMAPAKYHLALFHIRNNQRAEAATALQEAIKIQPDYDQAILLLAELDLQARRPDAVVPAMIALLNRRPNVEPAQLMLIAALRAQNRMEDAVRLIQDKIRENPANPQNHYLLGTTLVELKKNDEARAAFTRVLELSPGHFQSVSQLTDLDLREGKTDDASRRIEAGLGNTPESTGTMLLRARVHVARKEWTQSDVLLRKIIAEDSNHSPAYNLLLYSMLVRNQLPQAIAELETLRAKTPENLPVLLLSGLIYYQLGNLAKARETYEAYLAIKPDGSLALNNLALIYSEDPTRYDRALELARKAHEQEPNSAPIADTLGWIHYLRKDYAPALELLRKAMAGEPENPEILYHFALASAMSGNTEDARNAFQKAAAIPRDFKGKDQIPGHLARLPAAAQP